MNPSDFFYAAIGLVWLGGIFAIPYYIFVGEWRHAFAVCVAMFIGLVAGVVVKLAEDDDASN